jgi:hypothetical protein
MFVKIEHNQVYVIDILPHNEKLIFSRSDLIGIIQREWNYVLEPYEIKNMIGLSHNPSDEERSQARNANINAGLEMNGKVYLMLGHGVASSGDNIMASRLTSQLVRFLRDNENVAVELEEEFKKAILVQLGFLN